MFGARTDHREEGRERGKEGREVEEEWRKTVESVVTCMCWELVKSPQRAPLGVLLYSPGYLLFYFNFMVA